MTDGRFVGRSVLVTGGGSGIGRATALAFAAGGAQVVVSGRRPEPLAETVELIDKAGGTGYAVPADTRIDAEARALVEATVERTGGLDIAVNNAGIPSWGRVTEMDPAEWHEVVDTNLNGLWLCLRHQIEQMRHHGGGSIVNVGSRIGAHMRVSHQSAYAASKSAVSTLTRSAALEYIREGVRINAVSPGPTDTEMSVWPGEAPADRERRIERDVPAGRLADPAEIAAAIAWLASAEAAFVVGHDLVIDGGMSA
ncbi:glucose 1-dehydrogenase [Kribbella antibiotica]|uniref:Glucose 1-dehydrogenase n=1 Tax=Kribbella antibiotica TaxID=190195 RepID=A0A4R4ZU84_9ACTN|nr:glucose 1-dehydrogenase [Kribbella antibiotica]TDD62701.1 glucose 1-dehydrogenase [Kribbella antibiotica]